MITLIFANILVGLSSFFLSKIICPKKSSVDFILSWFVLFLAQIFLAELYLGIIGQFYFSKILAFHSLVFLIIFLIYTHGKNKYPSFPKPDINFLFSNKLLLFAISVFLGFFLVKVGIKLINPPVFPDALQYHLAFPATWIKNGNINNPLVIFGPKISPETFSALTYYPISAGLYFYWLMAPLRNAFLADVGQAPFYIFGILAIYSILRKFSLKKDTALFLGFLWVLIPNLFKQIKNGAQVDIICAVIFLIVLNHILLLKKEHSLKNFILLGIALGIFISIKATDIFWSFSLLPLFFYVFYTEQIPHRFFAIALLAFFSLLVGGYSYVNNYILTGNIFYPITFKLFGKTLMPGTIDRLFFAYIQYPWEEFTLKKVLFGEGLGLQLFSFVIPGIFIPLGFTPFLKMHFSRSERTTYIFLSIVPLFMLLEYLFYIKAFWIRYLFPFFGIALISFGIFLDRFNWGRKYITIVGFLCIIASMTELSKRWELVASLILSFILFFILIKAVTLRVGIYKNLTTIRLRIALAFIFIISVVFLNLKYNNEAASRYPLLFYGKEAKEKDVGLAWQWIYKNTSGGKRIAYTGRGEFYPLFGQGLVNDVFYVSVNDKFPLAHHYPDGLYRKEKDEATWLNNLKKKNVGLLVVYLPHDENIFPIENDWAEKNKDKFKLVFENSKVKIFSVSIN